MWLCQCLDNHSPIEKQLDGSQLLAVTIKTVTKVRVQVFAFVYKYSLLLSKSPGAITGGFNSCIL